MSQRLLEMSQRMMRVQPLGGAEGGGGTDDRRVLDKTDKIELMVDISSCP